MRRLCRLVDLPDGGTRSFGASPGGFTGLFAVRRGERAFVYVNACPHIGAALDAVPGRFLAADGNLIVCGTHGAAFRIEDGLCLRGPCEGRSLEPIPVEIVEGELLVPADAGL